MSRSHEARLLTIGQGNKIQGYMDIDQVHESQGYTDVGQGHKTKKD